MALRKLRPIAWWLLHALAHSLSTRGSRRPYLVYRATARERTSPILSTARVMFSRELA